MIAQGKAHPDDRFFLRFVEALNTPVVGPVMCLFGGGGIAFLSTRPNR
jgi:hypothetical protein